MMSLEQWLPVATAVIILAFAASVFRRYARSRRAYFLLWGVGLSMFGAANLAEAYSTLAWHPLAFRLWYLNGAMLNAAWLGQGTVFLLSTRKSLARGLLWLLIAGTLAAAVLVLTTPVDGTTFTVHEPLSAQYREILPPGAVVRKLTPVFNIYGLVTLVGGALYSAWLLSRKEIAAQRVAGNLLIAFGALVLAAASTQLRLGLADYLYAAELAAAAMMFAGFLLASAKTSPAPALERMTP